MGDLPKDKTIYDKQIDEDNKEYDEEDDEKDV